jgi:hypothetical protein
MDDEPAGKSTAFSDAKKKAVSVLFEKEIGDWLMQVGGLRRDQFSMEEQQDAKVNFRHCSPGL